jgi:hypothetical protein
MIRFKILQTSCQSLVGIVRGVQTTFNQSIRRSHTTDWYPRLRSWVSLLLHLLSQMWQQKLTHMGTVLPSAAAPVTEAALTSAGGLALGGGIAGASGGEHLARLQLPCILRSSMHPKILPTFHFHTLEPTKQH